MVHGDFLGCYPCFILLVINLCLVLELLLFQFMVFCCVSTQFIGNCSWLFAIHLWQIIGALSYFRDCLLRFFLWGYFLQCALCLPHSTLLLTLSFSMLYCCHFCGGCSVTSSYLYSSLQHTRLVELLLTITLYNGRYEYRYNSKTLLKYILYI